MAEFSVFGTGNKESRERLYETMDRYSDKFDTDKGNAPRIVTTFLKEERRTNEYLISIYEQCIRENKTVDKVIKYDYEMRDDVLY